MIYYFLLLLILVIPFVLPYTIFPLSHIWQTKNHHFTIWFVPFKNRADNRSWFFRPTVDRAKPTLHMITILGITFAVIKKDD